MQKFSSLGLSQPLIKAIGELGFENPTPIQEKAIPILLEANQDLIATAQTGTGKTAAFGLPVISNLDDANKNIQVFVLSPTRELCLQITKDLETYAKYCKNLKIVPVYGGASIETQIRALKRGCQIVVATPGRAKDLINRKKLNITSVKTLVLDEADEMLSMGFKDDLDYIFSFLPDDKQTLLFSATMSKEVKRLGNKILDKPIHIEAERTNSGTKNIVHQYLQVPAKHRYNTLKRLVDSEPEIYGIIFCRTRRETQEIADKLATDGYTIDTLHGDMSQAQRDDVMNRFRKGRIRLLVATDVAARGLDVNELTHVVNYNLPDDIEVYTHRSGRTGRAGNKGVSIAIINSREFNKIRQIEKASEISFKKISVPKGEEICKKQIIAMTHQIEKAPDIDESIKPFIEDVYHRLEHLSKEEIIKNMVSLRFNELLKYYKNSDDILSEEGQDSSRSSRRNREGFSRFFINAGKTENLNPARLLGIINEALPGEKVNVGQIEILKSFSFFEIEKTFETDVLNNFSKVFFKEKKLSIELAQNKNKPRQIGKRDRKFGKRRRF